MAIDSGRVRVHALDCCQIALVQYHMQKKSNSQLIYRSYISHCVKECEVFNETEIHLHSFAHKIIQKKIKLWM